MEIEGAGGVPSSFLPLSRRAETPRLRQEDTVAMTTAEEGRLKEIFKSALIEIFEERRDLVLDLVEEAIEEVAMARAIEEGRSTPLVSRNQIFELLDRTE